MRQKEEQADAARRRAAIQFGEFNLNIPVAATRFSRRPVTLRMSSVEADRLSFEVEVGDSVRCDVPLAVALEHREWVWPSEEEEVRTTSLPTPKAKSARNIQRTEKKIEQLDFVIPWDELSEKALEYVGKIDSVKYLNDRIGSARGWLNQASIESVVTIDSMLSPTNAQPGTLTVTYGQPTKAKSDMIISNYYRVERFFHSFSRLLLDRSVVWVDLWPRLLIGVDPSVVAAARNVRLHRMIDQSKRLRRIHEIMRVGKRGEIHRVTARDIIHVKLNDLNYTNLIVNENIKKSLSESVISSQYNQEDAHVIKEQKRAIQSPNCIPYVKLVLLQTSCKINNEFGLIIFKIKESKLVSCYKLLADKYQADVDSLLDAFQFMLYLPTRQTYISISHDQVKDLLDDMGEEFYRKEIFGAFYRRLKITEEGSEAVSARINSMVVNVGHNRVVMSTDLDSGQKPMLGRPMSIEEHLLERPPITLHMLTEKVISDFHDHIKQFESELRRDTAAIFLKHYNSVKRLHTRSRMYMVLNYGSRHN